MSAHADLPDTDVELMVKYIMGLDSVEEAKLAEERADASHLEHQPLQHLVAVCLGQQLAGLFRKIDQDRTGFEQGERLAVRSMRVDDRGDLVVGIQRKEFGRQLVIRREVHQMRLTGQAGFLKRDRHLDPVRGGERVKLDRIRIPRWPAVGDREVGEHGHRNLLAVR